MSHENKLFQLISNAVVTYEHFKLMLPLFFLKRHKADVLWDIQSAAGMDQND